MNLMIKKKVIEGNKLAFKRLVERKMKEGSYLIVSDYGKIVKVKAENIKL